MPILSTKPPFFWSMLMGHCQTWDGHKCNMLGRNWGAHFTSVLLKIKSEGLKLKKAIFAIFRI